jgi:uncharacterized protein (TIRG00374 family)
MIATTKEPRTARARRGLAFRTVISLAALGAVVYFFVRERDLFTGFGLLITHLDWPWVVLGFAAEMASIPALAEAQLLVLGSAGVKADRKRMNMLTLASNAISLSVPAGVAFAEGYSFAKYRSFGANSAIAAWSELASGAIAFSALAGVALVGALIAGGPAQSIVLPVLAVVFAGSVGAAVLFRHPPLLVRALEWLQGHAGRRIGRAFDRMTKETRDTIRSLTNVRPAVSLWATAGLLSGVNWFLDVVCLAVSFKAVRAAVPWGIVLLAFAGSKVVTSIGVTPGGLGIVEGGLVAVFVAYKTPAAAAGAAVLVYRALTLIGLVGIGWAFVPILARRVGPSTNR